MRRQKVLVIDDSYSNQLMMSTIIQRNLGFMPIRAASGKEAIKLLLERIIEKKLPSFSIVFLGLQMPVLDGFQTSMNIQQICKANSCPKPYIVALTVNQDLGLTEKCKEAGIDELVEKPVTLEKIKSIFSLRNLE